MNEFLLLAIIVIYLAISYLPGNGHGDRHEPSSQQRATETDDR